MYHTRSSLKFSGIIWPLKPNEIKSWNKKEKKRKNNQWNFACEWEWLPPTHNSHCTCGYFKRRFQSLFKIKREFEVCYHENIKRDHAWRVQVIKLPRLNHGADPTLTRWQQHRVSFGHKSTAPILASQICSSPHGVHTHTPLPFLFFQPT